MHLQLVVSLCLLALCAGHGRPPPTPSTTCPEKICVCSDSERSISPHQRSQPSIQAICKEMPRQRLPSKLKALRVNGSIQSITKNMIHILGGELLVLDLSGCGIHTIEQGSFDEAPNLHLLKLSNNQLEEVGPATFKGNRMLKVLYLDGNKLRNVESAFSKLNQLRELHLERNLLTIFPSKLPDSLEVLNISQNNIGSSLGSDMHETNLKKLDLCGNHVELTSTTFHGLNKLEYLCLGEDAVTFPENTANSLPHIDSLSLVASADQHAELDSVTQTELHAMNTLTSLSIVHYKVDSFTYLHGLNNLRHLELKDILAPDNIEIQSIMLSQKSLTVLSLEGSQNLAHALLFKMHVLGEMEKLKKLNLRRTNITHLHKLDIPQTEDFKLDISENPLICDCRFGWLLEKKQTKGAPQFLLNPADTVCIEPQQFYGQRLMDAINSLDCSSTQDETSSMTSNSDQSNLMTDTPMVGGGEEQPDPEQAVTLHPDMGENNADVNSEQTPGESNGDQGVQEMELTPGDFDSYGPESMPVGDKNDADNYSVLYIVLGCLLAILVLVGIILAIFYWHFKKTGSNKVTPETPQIPAEQSFQQLQQTEESALVKDVKKYSPE